MADRASHSRTELSVSWAVYVKCDMCTDISQNDYHIDPIRNCKMFEHLVVSAGTRRCYLWESVPTHYSTEWNTLFDTAILFSYS